MNSGCTLSNKQEFSASSEHLDGSSLLSCIKALPQTTMDSYSTNCFQGLSNRFPPVPSLGWQHLNVSSDPQELTDYVLQIIESAEDIICPGANVLAPANNGILEEFVGAPFSSSTKYPLPFDLMELEPTPIGPDAKVFPMSESPCRSMSGLANNAPSSSNVFGGLYPADAVPSNLGDADAFCQGAGEFASAGYAFSNNLDSSTASLKDKQGRRFRDYEADQWTERFTELLQFKDANGHCLVPHTYPSNPLLSQWVKRQRYQFKLKALGRHSTLTDDRQQMLEAAGFVWHCHQASWYEKLDALQKYQAHYGDCRVPPNYHDRSLAVWVKCQRRQWKLFRKGQRCSITKHRIDVLDKMGFEWNPRGL